MGSRQIVVQAPLFDDLPRVAEAAEPVLVEALVAQAAVEALDEGVLHRLARRDEAQAYAALVGPLVQRPARHLRPVVHDDLLRLGASAGDHPVQHPRHALARDRGVDLDGQRLPRVGVDHGQQLQPPPRRGGVRDEVQAPDLVRSARRLARSATLAGQPFALAPAQRQPFFSIQPVYPLVVHHHALPSEQHVQPPVAEALPQGGQLA